MEDRGEMLGDDALGDTEPAADSFAGEALRYQPQDLPLARSWRHHGAIMAPILAVVITWGTFWMLRMPAQ